MSVKSSQSRTPIFIKKKSNKSKKISKSKKKSKKSSGRKPINFKKSKSKKSSKNKYRNSKTYGVFNRTAKLYMLANATNDSLKSNYSYRLHELGVKSTKVKPHITMMHIHINMDNPDSKHLVKSGKNGLIINSLFKNVMSKKYNMMSSDIYLKSKNSYYDILGEFLAKVYIHNGNVQDITDFRMTMYLYLQMYLGEFKRSRVNDNGKVFFIYSYNGRELIAVPEYYHGKGVWKPHLSIVKMNKLSRHNPSLYNRFVDVYNQNNSDGVRLLTQEMKNVKGSMNSVNMKMHFDEFVITAMEI